MIARLRDWLRSRQLGRAALDAAGGYSRHATSQLAAAIAYRVLFSLIPLTAFLVAVIGVVLPSQERNEVADWMLSVVPGQALDPAVQRALTDSPVSPTAAGLVSLLVLLWSASSMMAAMRVAFRVIWENDFRRAYVRSKLLDFALVLGVGVLAIASIGATLIVQILAEIGRDLSDTLGAGNEGRILAAAAEVLTSAALTFAVLAVLYHTLPPVAPGWRSVWLPALLAALGFHVLTALYAAYLAQFGDLAAVYGPLGAVLGFLLVVYLGVTVILLGAELVAAQRPR